MAEITVKLTTTPIRGVGTMTEAQLPMQDDQYPENNGKVRRFVKLDFVMQGSELGAHLVLECEIDLDWAFAEKPVPVIGTLRHVVPEALKLMDKLGYMPTAEQLTQSDIEYVSQALDEHEQSTKPSNLSGVNKQLKSKGPKNPLGFPEL